jgi:hypothetical protein
LLDTIEEVEFARFRVQNDIEFIARKSLRIVVHPLSVLRIVQRRVATHCDAQPATTTPWPSELSLETAAAQSTSTMLSPITVQASVVGVV